MQEKYLSSDYDGITFIDLTKWGDYVGSSVERHNYLKLKEALGKRKGVYDISAGYGFHAIGYRKDEISRKTALDIAEIEEKLRIYPLCDEDEYSEMCDSEKREYLAETWDEWAHDVWNEFDALEPRVQAITDGLKDSSLYDDLYDYVEEDGYTWYIDEDKHNPFKKRIVYSDGKYEIFQFGRTPMFLVDGGMPFIALKKDYAIEGISNGALTPALAEAIRETVETYWNE